MISEKKIKEIIFDLEKDPKLYRFRSGGFTMYFILRFNIEMVLRRYYAANDDNQVHRRKGKWRLPVNFLRTQYHKYQNRKLYSQKLVQFDDVSKIQKSRYLFVSTSTLKDENGGSVELVEIIKHLKKDGEAINFVQPSYTLDIPVRLPLHDVYLPVHIQGEDSLSPQEGADCKALIDYLDQHLEPDFGAHFNGFTLYLAQIKYRAPLLASYIKRVGCKHVFCRSAYTEPWVLMACAEAGVRCIEVQHGVVLPHSVYYQSSVPKNDLGKDTLLMPYNMLMLGEEWSEVICSQEYIYTDQNTFVIGTDVAKEKLNEVTETQHNKSGVFKVLIVSQPGIFNCNGWLYELLQDRYPELLELSIKLIFRPHPSESRDYYQNLEREYPGVAEFQSPEVQIYAAIRAADVIFGGTSMCLYEALTLGKLAMSMITLEDQTVPDNIQFAKSSSHLFEALKEVRDRSDRGVEKKEYLSPFRKEVLDRYV